MSDLDELDERAESIVQWIRQSWLRWLIACGVIVVITWFAIRFWTWLF